MKLIWKLKIVFGLCFIAFTLKAQVDPVLKEKMKLVTESAGGLKTYKHSPRSKQTNVSILIQNRIASKYSRESTGYALDRDAFAEISESNLKRIGIGTANEPEALKGLYRDLLLNILDQQGDNGESAFNEFDLDVIQRDLEEQSIHSGMFQGGLSIACRRLEQIYTLKPSIPENRLLQKIEDLKTFMKVLNFSTSELCQRGENSKIFSELMKEYFDQNLEDPKVEQKRKLKENREKTDPSLFVKGAWDGDRIPDTELYVTTLYRKSCDAKTALGKLTGDLELLISSGHFKNKNLVEIPGSDGSCVSNQRYAGSLSDLTEETLRSKAYQEKLIRFLQKAQ